MGQAPCSGGFAFAFLSVALFNQLGAFGPPIGVVEVAWKTAVICAAATLVEALPIRDLDNLTITVTAVVLGIVLF